MVSGGCREFSATRTRLLTNRKPFAPLARFWGMPSTAIREFDYRPESQELLVTFVTGRRYLYEGVPEEVARRFRSAISKGRFFNANIRDRYPYRELQSIDLDLD
jgi:hypothetical protein